MRVVLVIFNHQLAPKKYYKQTKHILWHFFLKQFNVWHKHVDKLYALDYLCNLTVPTWAKHLSSKIEIVDNFPNPNHYESLEKFVPKISEGNDLLIVDSDMIIHDPRVVENGFELLKEYDAVGPLTRDGTGPKEPGTILDRMEWRGWKGKLANWLTFVRGKWTLNGKFFPVPWKDFYYDPLTQSIIEGNGKIKELREDCWQLMCNENGFTHEEWSEHTDFEFVKFNYSTKNLGFYHIMRASHMWKILDNSFEHPAFDYYAEQLRLGAWAYLVTETVAPDKLKLFDEGLKQHPHFKPYYEQFKAFHQPILKGLDFL